MRSLASKTPPAKSGAIQTPSPIQSSPEDLRPGDIYYGSEGASIYEY